MLNCKI